MLEASVSGAESISRAEEAAEFLFNTRDASAEAIYEPRNSLEANAAVQKLGRLFEDLPGVAARMLEGSGGSAGLLSSDRLQGLGEIVQNANDAGATQVRLLLTPNALLITHDGSPVRLHHLLGFATPWISTKGDDPTAIGRFGIGLMTLRALSETMEVHCPPYHVQIGEPAIISPIGRPELPAGFQEFSWTTLRIPLEDGAISSDELIEWLDRWDDAALLFLRNVLRVTLVGPRGETVRELTLSRDDDKEIAVSTSAVVGAVSRHHAKARDGRSWAVYSADVQSRQGLSRARKSTGPTTPVSVALPLGSVQSGMVYAGLPVAQADSTLFVESQFDPLTNRLDFADNEWNRALVPLVAEVWSHAALDLFRRDPKVAWLAMPTSASDEVGSRLSLVESLEEAITRRASQWLASHLSFQTLEQGTVPLSELAVEERPLESILTETEIARLADLPATLPSAVRDEYGRWRAVLEDWRSAGADLPELVSVEEALDLMGDETRPADSTIALAAVALDEDLGDILLGLRCVVAHDGKHLVPPNSNSPNAVASEATPLALQLGLVTLLHDAYLSGDEAANKVLAWLEKSGALLDSSDDRALVYRLAAAGQSGRRLESPLTDEQAQALRAAFELMDPDERSEVGADVGRAVLLEAYTYDGENESVKNAHPADAYLPGRIDRETDSFAVAAGQTPGLVWISGKYVDVLRSPAGRSGIGALRFLRILGAETAPRVRQHPQLESRYSSDPRRGLSRYTLGGPEARESEMRKRDATYTLQDYDSPDLQAVVEDISHERRKRDRRRRAAALLATIGRAWDRRLSEFAEVESAYDHFYWHEKGRIRAYWLWQVGDIAWLDDESGTPRRPVELRVRTPGNIAIYGENSPNYLHRELHKLDRQAVFSAIGVSGDPSRSELVDRLRRLRDASSEGEATLTDSDLHREAAIVYKALAHDLESTTSRSDLSSNQLRGEFQKGQGLLLTNLGWLPPRGVLAGPSIFRDYAAFVPQVEGSESLWEVLNLRKPSPSDCLEVIQKIASKRHAPDIDDEAILLETLRALASHYREGNTVNSRRLSALALWTSKDWIRNRTHDRPVYATDDPILANGLRDQIPLWEPGGELEQFESLLNPMRVKQIGTADAEVIDPTLAEVNIDATELFQNALRLLEEDLARNDPELAESIRAPWETLRGFDVRVHPSLRLRVDVDSKGYVSEIDAKVDDARASMFIKDPSVLPRVTGGGRALAELFEGNARRIAQAWRAACDQAEEGIEARRLELAQQRDERDRARREQEISSRTSAFQDRTAAKAGTRILPFGGTRGTRRAGPKAIDLGSPRILVDTTSLKIVNPQGRIEKGTSIARPQKGGGGGLVDPSPTSTPPRNRTPIRGYSDKDREDVGMELVHMLLSSDHEEIKDLRAQRNVGADAVDDMKRFYELKVIAGAEPDRVDLTISEVQRAMSDDKFFLIVVSGLEGVDASPKARVFVDPLNQLQRTYNGSITLSGVRNAKGSLVYEFAPIGDGAVSSDDEEAQ